MPLQIPLIDLQQWQAKPGALDVVAIVPAALLEEPEARRKRDNAERQSPPARNDSRFGPPDASAELVPSEACHGWRQVCGDGRGPQIGGVTAGRREGCWIDLQP